MNVEPSRLLRAGDPLGGHIVQGHVDGVGAMRARTELTWFGAPPEITRYCVEKGSIAVDGTSLTVAAVDDEGFAVALIPHTLEATTLGSLEPGDPVNLEVDVLMKGVGIGCARERGVRERSRRRSRTSAPDAWSSVVDDPLDRENEGG